jgi:hypothetical protein
LTVGLKKESVKYGKFEEDCINSLSFTRTLFFTGVQAVALVVAAAPAAPAAPALRLPMANKARQVQGRLVA